MSKGSNQRPLKVAKHVFDENWENTFGKKDVPCVEFTCCRCMQTTVQVCPKESLSTMCANCEKEAEQWAKK